ncbi:UNVERIFIED_CONTAM: hypothetical protein Sangu_2977700 [Sesamum angustifolium]|uniref:Reverse transcriptase domain-containing protein n=1 Tax=Sesamum angustifolium TaxID=2727405 RepID=A0AAW2IK53_9LAMI
MDRCMVDEASGGAVIDKTPDEAQHLISTMAENYRQYGYHTDKGQRQETIVCEICSNIGHPTDACPSLQGGVMPNVNAVGGFSGQPQRRYDPHSNFYNPGWRDHPNFSYRNQGEQSKPHQQSFNRAAPAPAQALSKPPNSGMSLEDIVKSLTFTTQQIQQDTTLGLQEAREGLQETRANLQHLGNQIFQLTTSVSKLEAQASGKLPSQTETNPRENVSAITFWSEKELQPTGPTLKKARIERNALDDTDATHDEVDSNLIPPPLSNTCALPFPYRMSKSKEEEHENEILDSCKKVEINILLLDAIKQIPKYAKFLKELCTNKRKLKDKERIIFDVENDFVETLSEALRPLSLDESNYSTTHTKLLPSVLQAPKLELKPLSEHLKYIYLGNEETLPAIIYSKLSKDHEEKLVTLLREHRTAIGWTLADIKEISPAMCMDRIYLEDNTKPSREPQIRLNPTLKEGAMKELLKLLDAGYYQTAIAQEDEEKTTFTCPFSTSAFRHMPFGLCNALGTFQRCMMSIFSEYIKKRIEVFMDDFTVYGGSFDECLSHLAKVLRICIETNLVLNFEKCHFMVDQDIVLGHVISSRGIEVDKAKVECLIVKLFLCDQ